MNVYKEVLKDGKICFGTQTELIVLNDQGYIIEVFHADARDDESYKEKYVEYTLNKLSTNAPMVYEEMLQYLSKTDIYYNYAKGIAIKDKS